MNVLYLVSKVPEVMGGCQTSGPRPHHYNTVPASLVEVREEGQRSRYIGYEAGIDIPLPCEEAENARDLGVAPDTDDSTKTESLETLLCRKKRLQSQQQGLNDISSPPMASWTNET